MARERRGKGCGMDEGSQTVFGAWRATMEVTMGRVLQPPVMVSMEVQYYMKEGEIFSTTPSKY